MADGYLLGRSALDQIQQLIREDRARYANPGGHRARYLDTGVGSVSCTLWYQLSVEGNPSGGTFAVLLRDRRSGGQAIIVVTLNWDDDDDDVRTALAVALGLAESEITVSDGPLPNNAMWILLPAGLSIFTTTSVVTPTLTRNGPVVPYSRVTSCCR